MPCEGEHVCSFGSHLGPKKASPQRHILACGRQFFLGSHGPDTCSQVEPRIISSSDHKTLGIRFVQLGPDLFSHRSLIVR